MYDSLSFSSLSSGLGASCHGRDDASIRRSVINICIGGFLGFAVGLVRPSGRCKDAQRRTESVIVEVFGRSTEGWQRPYLKPKKESGRCLMLFLIFLLIVSCLYLYALSVCPR
jgi:hypothetical protein